MIPALGSELGNLVAGMQTLLLDFDGPVCDMFAGYPAATIAQKLREVIARQVGPLPESMANESDPLQLLRGTPQLGNPRLTDAVSRLMRQAEQRAITSAVPTPYADKLLAAAFRAGCQVAIVSNNSPEAIWQYLKRTSHDLSIKTVIARSPELQLADLKPSPHLLEAALKATGTSAEHALFVGDSISDVTAARSAGVRVVGYANRPHKRQTLTEAGADAVVTSMADLADAIRRADP